jgi:hypothetical protein
MTPPVTGPGAAGGYRHQRYQKDNQAELPASALSSAVLATFAAKSTADC